MNWQQVAKRLAGAAPALGAALAGPAGGVVGAVIADKLGVAATPAAVARQIEADPDAMARLAEVEADLAKAAMADTQDTREGWHGTWVMGFTAAFATMILGIFAWVLYRLAEAPLPAPNAEAFNAQTKVLEYLIIAAASFFLGSSVGSKLKGPRQD